MTKAIVVSVNPDSTLNVRTFEPNERLQMNDHIKSLVMGMEISNQEQLNDKILVYEGRPLNLRTIRFVTQFEAKVE
jgi:uncharacterized protein (UPF0128 family)